VFVDFAYEKFLSFEKCIKWSSCLLPRERVVNLLGSKATIATVKSQSCC